MLGTLSSFSSILFYRGIEVALASRRSEFVHRGREVVAKWQDERSTAARHTENGNAGTRQGNARVKFAAKATPGVSVKVSQRASVVVTQFRTYDEYWHRGHRKNNPV